LTSTANLSSLWNKPTRDWEALVGQDAGGEATGAWLRLRGELRRWDTRRDGEAGYDDESSVARELQAVLDAAKDMW
jgi:hypothetical protein